MRQYPKPEHAEIASREPQHRDLLAAIVHNRAYARNPVTGRPRTVREQFEAECG